MSRAGVSNGIAERVLGHVIPGVAGVYDHPSCVLEKRSALEKLCGLVIVADERIGTFATELLSVNPTQRLTIVLASGRRLKAPLAGVTLAT